MRIDSERLEIFLQALEPPRSPLLEQLRSEAVAQRVPIIRQDTESFLEVFLALLRPERILEVGTAVGYSALLMAQATGDECRITTIENYGQRIRAARENIASLGYGDRIELLEGDAQDILPTLHPFYDLIFMDAAKGQYLTFLPMLLPLLREGGVLLSDNILQDGDILESRYAVERRDRTIHRRMREYLYRLKHDPQLVTSIVPVGDGMSVSVKKCRSDQK